MTVYVTVNKNLVDQLCIHKKKIITISWWNAYGKDTKSWLLYFFITIYMYITTSDIHQIVYDLGYWLMPHVAQWRMWLYSSDTKLLGHIDFCWFGWSVIGNYVR